MEVCVLVDAPKQEIRCRIHAVLLGHFSRAIARSGVRVVVASRSGFDVPFIVVPAVGVGNFLDPKTRIIQNPLQLRPQLGPQDLLCDAIAFLVPAGDHLQDAALRQLWEFLRKVNHKGQGRCIYSFRFYAVDGQHLLVEHKWVFDV